MSAEPIETRVNRLEEFAAEVRGYAKILTDMIRRHDERLDEQATLFHEANQAIAALADAQIRTEEALIQFVQHGRALHHSAR